ncbi:MAG: ScpA family protein [Pseudomonadota bacterium]|nr:ScpA family protein [Pseudomonadota bacterium]
MENQLESSKAEVKLDSQEQPLAMVKGSPLEQLPLDLYVPPDALEVMIRAFEGPLDLLLYLIKKQNLDILDVEISQITEQYMQYIEAFQEMRFELAAEYLVMAAFLAEIKSRMLLPVQSTDEEEEEDPRANLIMRLQEYERFKIAAFEIDELNREFRDFWSCRAGHIQVSGPTRQPDVALRDLVLEFARVVSRAELKSNHPVQLEVLSTRDRMVSILRKLESGPKDFVAFGSFFSPQEGKKGVVVTFMAVLELIKEGLLETVQGDQFAPIYIKLA